MNGIRSALLHPVQTIRALRAAGETFVRENDEFAKWLQFQREESERNVAKMDGGEYSPDHDVFVRTPAPRRPAR